jgi:hypothetical protein
VTRSSDRSQFRARARHFFTSARHVVEQFRDFLLVLVDEREIRGIDRRANNLLNAWNVPDHQVLLRPATARCRYG